MAEPTAAPAELADLVDDIDVGDAVVTLSIDAPALEDEGAQRELLLKLDREEAFALNATGAVIARRLANRQSLHAIVEGLSQEFGVDEATVARKGRLKPGKLFVVDLERHAVFADGEVELEVANQKPYGRWYETSAVRLDDLPHATAVTPAEPEVLTERKPKEEAAAAEGDAAKKAPAKKPEK